MLKRAHKNFSFVNGRCGRSLIEQASSNHASSIGNYFLSAAQIFFRSLPSAIFLFSSITNSQVRLAYAGICMTTQLTPVLQANIIPVIVTNHTVTIAAELVRLPSLVVQPH